MNNDLNVINTAEAASASLMAVLKTVLGETSTPVALHEPEFSGHEWDYVKNCLDTGWVSSVGHYVDEFETRLAEFTGAKYAIAVVNGTAALQVALMVSGVRPGDEVLVPTLTFIATANAISHCGAIPHFIDSDFATTCVSAEKLEEYLTSITEPSGNGFRNRLTGKRLAALVPMHCFGHMSDMTEIARVCKRFNITIVEDAAEALGSYIKGKHAGTFGLTGTLSFNGNKIITTGGGGAILTDDPKIAQHAKHLATTAKVPHRWAFNHDEIAFNYRLPNLNAALGCAQLESLPDKLLRKRKLAQAYKAAFASNMDFDFIDEPAGTQSNFWLAALRLREADRDTRDAVLTTANDAGYQCRPVWTLMHRLPMYQACPRSTLDVAEALEASIINLPSSAKLADRISSGG